MFRKGKRPMWEDFQEGGTWIVHFKRREWEVLNKKWESLLLGTFNQFIQLVLVKTSRTPM